MIDGFTLNLREANWWRILLALMLVAELIYAA